MKRIPATALALALALGAGGCVDNHASVQIFAICAPPEDAAVCGTDGECAAVLANRPWVDTLLDPGDPAATPPIPPTYNSLDLFVQVNNRMPDNSDESAGRVNTNDAIIELILYEFEVQGFTVLGVAPVLGTATFEYPLSQTVPSNSSSTPLVPIIPPEIMGPLDTLLAGDDDGEVVVLAHVAFAGHLEDGTDFETAPHMFAVNVYWALVTPPVCPKAPAEIVTAICPHKGQTASFTCEAP